MAPSTAKVPCLKPCVLKPKTGEPLANELRGAFVSGRGRQTRTNRACQRFEYGCGLRVFKSFLSQFCQRHTIERAVSLGVRQPAKQQSQRTADESTHGE